MFLSRASVPEILSAAATLKPSANDALMVLLAEQDAPDLEAVRAALADQGYVFFGGLFPAVLAHGRAHPKGAILAALPVLGSPLVFTGLDRADTPTPELERVPEGSPTAIILADGQTPGISEFLAGIFGQMGPSARCLGGGAGNSALARKPCLFTAGGVLQDAAILAFVRCSGSLGVQHGLTRVAGPIAATRTGPGGIEELNWRPACGVSRGILEKDSGLKIAKDHFYKNGHSWAYPFGLVREGAEDVVREPLAVTEDGGIRCGGGVPENAVLHVMKGQARDLIAAARQAAHRAAAGVRGRPRYAMVCDCISRQFFLRNQLADELEAVASEIHREGFLLEPEGMLTLGEIASAGESVLDFFNKTIVVGILSDA
ncbi:MAG: FIST C-terminal domain-containing protein [Kiritimatiellae bacterium]|nr:FIST C-terminal domain-containing protein [Kiritimatiellia bacterium]